MNGSCCTYEWVMSQIQTLFLHMRDMIHSYVHICVLGLHHFRYHFWDLDRCPSQARSRADDPKFYCSKCPGWFGAGSLHRVNTFNVSKQQASQPYCCEFPNDMLGHIATVSRKPKVTVHPNLIKPCVALTRRKIPLVTPSIECVFFEENTCNSALWQQDNCPFHFEKNDNSNRVTGHFTNMFTENDWCFGGLIQTFQISIGCCSLLSVAVCSLRVNF